MTSDQNVVAAKDEVASAVKEITTTINVARNERKDRLLSPEELDDKYNSDGTGEHPKFLRSMWREAVVQEKTFDGYWQWVAYCIKNDYESI